MTEKDQIAFPLICKGLTRPVERYAPCGSTTRQRWQRSDPLDPTPRQRPCNAPLCSSWCSLTCLQMRELRSYWKERQSGYIHVQIHSSLQILNKHKPQIRVRIRSLALIRGVRKNVYFVISGFLYSSHTHTHTQIKPTSWAQPAP